MKRNIKTYILGFITGAVIFSSIGVMAYSLNAHDIGFTPSNSNWNVDNLEDAMNDLYSSSSVKAWNVGNPLNLYFYNGASIKKDENGDKYLSFDGVDDYIALDTLPASINWEDGFTIEFTAQWDAFNDLSRIFHFGNGTSSDHIGLENYGKNGRILLYVSNGSGLSNSITENSLMVNTTYNIKITYLKNDNGTFDVKYYVNNELFYSTTTSTKVKNIERKNNYLGNYPYISNRAFKGRIYNLKINQADGVNIINIDADKMFSE